MRGYIFVMMMVLLGGSSGGCSVGMALHGADNPDMQVLRYGAYQSEIESEFGRPKKYVPEERRALYHYSTGESGSPGRAIAHAAGDVLTLGLWEVVGTPIEAVQSHQQWALDVWYTDQSTVTRWDGPRRR